MSNPNPWVIVGVMFVMAFLLYYFGDTLRLIGKIVAALALFLAACLVVFTIFAQPIAPNARTLRVGQCDLTSYDGPTVVVWACSGRAPWRLWPLPPAPL